MKWLIAVLMILAVALAGCAPQAAPEPTAPVPAPVAPAVPAPAETAPADSVPDADGTEAEPKTQPMTGEFIATKEDGVIRGVGCDADSNTVMFELHNPTETDWAFYKKVSPTPPNQIKVSFNGLTLLDLDCDAELLAAGETVKCSKTGAEAKDLVKFRDPRTEFNDDLSTIATGGRDGLKFRCIPRGEFAPAIQEDYSSRVE